MSEILDIAHDMARDLVKVGPMDGITMRKLDAFVPAAQAPPAPGRHPRRP